MKSDIVLRIEKALKEYTPSKIDGVRIATARGILTAYEIAVKNGLSEAGKVGSLKSWGYSTKYRRISALSLHTKDATVN